MFEPQLKLRYVGLINLMILTGVDQSFAAVIPRRGASVDTFLSKQTFFPLRSVLYIASRNLRCGMFVFITYSASPDIIQLCITSSA